MNSYIERLNRHIEPLRQDIINHKVYASIRSVRDLRIFMEHHVYAVWDFMSLLKSLQNDLTCTAVPWFPKGEADTRFLINEIVVGEESDVAADGNRTSHFEIYLTAMDQCGANTSNITAFVAALRTSGDFTLAFDRADVPPAVRKFVNGTFKIIASAKNYLQSAIFTFGREDLIPGMFISMVKDLDKNIPGSVSIFKYYLERHIEVDGGHHSQLALQMTSGLCGNNEQYWQEAEQAVLNPYSNGLRCGMPFMSRSSLEKAFPPAKYRQSGYCINNLRS